MALRPEDFAHMHITRKQISGSRRTGQPQGGGGGGCWWIILLIFILYMLIPNPYA